jgi:hypothetical protein
MSGLVWESDLKWIKPIPGRHAAVRDGTPWSEVRKRTGEGRHKIAKYHPDITDEELRTLELSFEESNLIVEHQTVRFYCVKHSRVVGASCGEDTCYVKINRHQNGDVHGHPNTAQELMSYIMKKNPELLARLKKEGFFE